MTYRGLCHTDPDITRTNVCGNKLTKKKGLFGSLLWDFQFTIG